MNIAGRCATDICRCLECILSFTSNAMWFSFFLFDLCLVIDPSNGTHNAKHASNFAFRQIYHHSTNFTSWISHLSKWWHTSLNCLNGTESHCQIIRSTYSTSALITRYNGLNAANTTQYNCILDIKINVLNFKSDKRIKQTTELSLLSTKKDQKFIHSPFCLQFPGKWKFQMKFRDIFNIWVFV